MIELGDGHAALADNPSHTLYQHHDILISCHSCMPQARKRAQTFPEQDNLLKHFVKNSM